MGILTPFFNLFKPAKTDKQAVAKLNENFDTIDTEMHRPPLTVNGVEPDSETRDLYLETVPLADNLTSDNAQLNTGEFIQRTSGGSASIEDGKAYLVSIKGNMVKTGYVAEELTMTVTPAERAEGVDPITATLDRDTFVAYVSQSGTVSLTYTTAWSADPALYGITVTGTPVSGDAISVVYVKEDRGTITPANPTAWNSTGWNLYDNTAGYAKVVKYSDSFGFLIGGNYSLLEFASTVSGTRQTITVSDGYFQIPADGFVFVTGGDATTYILMTWSDWLDGYEGAFESYTDDVISLSAVMVSFPNGLLAVGAVRDEINLNTQKAISRIERKAYTAENLAAVIASGQPYDTDTNYIYVVRSAPVSTDIDVDGEYTVSDHGIEFFSTTTVDCIVEVLYGNNLKNKLERDVVTISGGLVNNLTSTATDKALTAAQGKVLNDQIGNLSSLNTTAKNNLVAATNEIYAKDYNPAYNANTDRNTESNRTTVMEYLKTNYFNYGYTKAAVRYSSGYYHFYLYMGEYGGADACILEVCHNMTPVFIVWRRTSAGVYSKVASM